jgi:ribosomal protein S18 acetylase RimI-like enzyme
MLDLNTEEVNSLLLKKNSKDKNIYQRNSLSNKINLENNIKLKDEFYLKEYLIQEDENFYYRKLNLINSKKDLEDIKIIQDSVFPIKYDEKFYNNLINKSTYLTIVCFDKKTLKMIGACASRISKDKIEKFCFCLKFKRNVCYIMTLGVLEEFRRNGCATKLLNIMENEVIKQYGKIFNLSKFCLHCKSDNLKALNFYEKMKYQKDKLLENFYYINDVYEDAYYLKKDLKFKGYFF